MSVWVKGLSLAVLQLVAWENAAGYMDRQMNKWINRQKDRRTGHVRKIMVNH